MKFRFLTLAILSFIVLPYTVSFGQNGVDNAKAKREALRRCRSLLRETLKEIDAGNYDAALADIDSVLLCDPKNADGYYHRGRIFIRKNDTTAAVAALTDGVKMAPLSTRIRLLLARLKLGLNAIDEASEQIDKVLAIKPHQSEALYLKGMAQLAKADTSQAVETFEKSLDLYFARGK